MTQPKRMHLSSYYPSCLFFFIFFSFVFSLLGYFTRLLSSRQRARHHKKKKKKLFRMAQKWWMRCKNEQDMHHEDSQIAPVSDNAHYCITNKTLFELQGHTKIFIYIFIISLEMTVLHVTVGLLGPRVITWWVTSAMPRLTERYFCLFSRCDDRRAEKEAEWKETRRKEESKKLGWGTSAGKTGIPANRLSLLPPPFESLSCRKCRKKEKKRRRKEGGGCYDTNGQGTQRHSTRGVYTEKTIWHGRWFHGNRAR